MQYSIDLYRNVSFGLCSRGEGQGQSQLVASGSLRTQDSFSQKYSERRRSPLTELMYGFSLWRTFSLFTGHAAAPTSIYQLMHERYLQRLSGIDLQSHTVAVTKQDLFCSTGKKLKEFPSHFLVVLNTTGWYRNAADQYSTKDDPARCLLKSKITFSNLYILLRAFIFIFNRDTWFSYLNLFSSFNNKCFPVPCKDILKFNKATQNSNVKKRTQVKTQCRDSFQFSGTEEHIVAPPLLLSPIAALRTYISGLYRFICANIIFFFQTLL